MPKTRRRTKNKASANIKRRTKRRSPRRSPRRSSPVMRLNPNAKYKRRRKQKGGDIFGFMKSDNEKTNTADNILQKLNNISDELKKLKEPISELSEDDRIKVDQKIKELIDLHIEMKPAEAAKGANESPGADVSALGAEGSIGVSPGAEGSVDESPGAEGSIDAEDMSPELVDAVENDGEGNKKEEMEDREKEDREREEREREDREKEEDKGVTGGNKKESKSGSKKLRRKN